MMRTVAFVLDIKTVNELNRHEHWRVRAKRAKKQHGLAMLVTASKMPWPWLWPVTVSLTRLSPSKGLDAHDGLPASQKFIVDGIAEALGVDDADPRITWTYAQERGPGGSATNTGYAVRVAIAFEAV
jgi:hypothetical protein